MNAYQRVVSEIARTASSRVVRRAVRACQRLSDTLAADDSGLRNTWDEIYPQTQGEQSLFPSAYEDTLRAVVRAELKRFTSSDYAATSLQAEQGIDWRTSDEAARSAAHWEEGDVVEYPKSAVLDEADVYSNARIRRYLYSLSPPFRRLPPFPSGLLATRSNDSSELLIEHCNSMI